MALTIKNPDVERLLDELIQMTGESKTEAVRRALEERRQRLSPKSGLQRDESSLLTFLQTEIWPQIPAELLGVHLPKADKEEILGYGVHGV